MFATTCCCLLAVGRGKRWSMKAVSNVPRSNPHLREALTPVRTDNAWLGPNYLVSHVPSATSSRCTRSRCEGACRDRDGHSPGASQERPRACRCHGDELG